MRINFRGVYTSRILHYRGFCISKFAVTRVRGVKQFTDEVFGVLPYTILTLDGGVYGHFFLCAAAHVEYSPTPSEQ